MIPSATVILKTNSFLSNLSNYFRNHYNLHKWKLEIMKKMADLTNEGKWACSILKVKTQIW